MSAQAEALVQTADQLHALVGRFRLVASDDDEVELDAAAFRLQSRGPAWRKLALPRAS